MVNFVLLEALIGLFQLFEVIDYYRTKYQMFTAILLCTSTLLLFYDLLMKLIQARRNDTL